MRRKKHVVKQEAKAAGTSYSRKIPLWYQLAQILRSEIVNGIRGAASKIAPEVELAIQYGISVITVRQAMKLLEEQGLVTRRRGRGSFVVDAIPASHLPQNTDAMQVMFAERFTEVDILDRGVVPVPPSLERLFPEENQLLRVRRIVRLQGAPFSYAVIHVPPALGARIPSRDLMRFPMFEILRRLGYSLEHVDLRFQAIAAPGNVADLLGCEAFSPILTVSPVITINSRTICALTIYYPGETLHFSVNMDLRKLS